MRHTTGQSHIGIFSVSYKVWSSDITDEGVIVCGGDKTPDSCIRLAPGAEDWTHYATISPRMAHSSWVTPSGKIMLFAGTSPHWISTTEIVGEGISFNVKQQSQ